MENLEDETGASGDLGIELTTPWCSLYTDPRVAPLHQSCFCTSALLGTIVAVTRSHLGRFNYENPYNLEIY